MKKHLCFLLLLILTLAILLAMSATANADEIIAFGTCGDKLSWTLNGDGLLLIEGEGEMDDWEENQAPWSPLRTKIVAVHVGDGVTSIGANAFSFCAGLTDIDFADTVTSLHESAFSFCMALEEITIPDKVVSIQDVFGLCPALRVIRLGACMTISGYSNPSDTLEQIEVSEMNLTLKSIGGVLFSKDGKTLYSCPAGRTDSYYEVPDGVESIATGAISKVKALKELVLPEGLFSLESDAIRFCHALETIVIPTTLHTNVGSFSGCDKLKHITVRDGNAYLRDIDGILFSADGKTLYFYPAGRTELCYEVPVGVETIAEDAITNVDALEELVLPEGLQSLDSWAIYGCFSLERIRMPSTLRILGDNAIKNCSQDIRLCFDGPEALLAGIRIGWSNQTILSTGFELGQEHAVLHIISLEIKNGWPYYLAAEGFPFPALPELPPKDGVYLFRGWYWQTDEGKAWATKDAIYDATENITLTSAFWDVRQLQVVACGGILMGADEFLLSEKDGYALTELLPDPIREGWRFTGWTLDADGTEPMEPGQSFSSDGVLYAQWEPLVERTVQDMDIQDLATLRLQNPSGSSLMTYQIERWSSPIENYLVAEDDGSLTCVCRIKGALLVNRYEPDGTLRSEQRISLELPLFGGFFAGKTYYYVITGQKNLQEDDELEVIRVTCYDRDWNRIDSAAVRNCFTTIPFDAGTLHAAENGNALLIHTCRVQYMTGDGANHQTQLTIWLDKKQMAVRNYLGGGQINHVSHSFYQFVVPGKEGFALLDLGDAYPRAVVLDRMKTYSSADKLELFSFPGETGANCTGISIGGFATTEDYYVAAINSIDHSLATGYNSNFIEGIDRECRDVLILSTGTDNKRRENVVLTKLTDYVPENKGGSAPYLVRVGPDLLCALWEEYQVGPDSKQQKAMGVRYVFLNGNGTPLTDVFRLAGARLSSDCEPIIWNDRITWFVDDAGNRTLYMLRYPSTDTNGANVAVTGTERNGNMLRMTTFCHVERAKLFCAWYRADGRLLELRTADSIYGINSLQFEDVPQAATCRVFFTDEGFRPVSASQTVEYERMQT